MYILYIYIYIYLCACEYNFMRRSCMFANFVVTNKIGLCEANDIGFFMYTYRSTGLYLVFCLQKFKRTVVF